MAKFKFRLARVAKIKMILEEQAKQNWAIANSQLQLEISQLNSLKQQLLSGLDFGYQELELSYRPILHGYKQTMDIRIQMQQEAVNKAVKQEQIAREAWTQARQEKEMLDRLREKNYQAHCYEQARKEQNQLDELKNTVPIV